MGLLDWAAPPRCACCDEVTHGPFCPLCAEALEPAGALSLPGFDEARALFLFGGPMAVAIHRFKEQGREDVGRALAEMLRGGNVSGSYVVPMPGDPRRTRRRGLNPPWLLAAYLGRRRHWARRPLARPPQRSLRRADRWNNVHDGFEVSGSVRGRDILVVDDVVTTGATACSLARRLRRAGARRCRLLALAHAEW
jgi:ComF family protein